VIQSGTARRRGILVVAYSVLAISCGDSLSPADTDVDRVDVAPSAVALTVGETRAITAQVYGVAGERLVNRRVVWTTQDATVATVSQSGVITGTGSGNTQIAASAGGKSGLVAVSVNARPVSLVRVVPSTATVQTGLTITLAAEALDASGAEVIGRPVNWASSNSAIASVSAAGQVTGVAVGSATITATIDGIPGTATVTVTSVPAASVRITPATGTVQQGGALQLTATALDGQGAELPGRTATWSSSNESIATVSSTGRVVGIAEGAFTITARIDAVSGTGSYSVTKIPVGLVTVSPSNVTLSVGQTQPMTVNLFAADRTTPLPIGGRIITWTSSNTAVVSVSSSGVVAGVSSGSATITAATEGVSGTATVNVTAVPIASISVTPSPATVVEGGTTTLVATARDAGGNVLAGRTIFWSSSNPQVSVSQGGVVTAVVNSAAQTASINASAPGGGVGGATPSAVVSVSVTYAPVAVVSLAPPSQTITVGQTTTFALTLQEAGGLSLTSTGRTVSWQSLNPAIVTVNPTTGAVTGVSQGGPVGIEVSAGSPGQGTPARDTGYVTVSNVPVVTVTVSPDPATVHVGSTYSRTFTAVTKDGSGNVLTGRSIIWTSADQNVATVNASTGVVTGEGLGSTTITATSEGVPGNASVSVDLVAIDSVVVSPATVTLSPGLTQSLTWAARDSAGNAVTGAALGGRTPGWTSSQTAVATVSSSGVVTAVAPGTSVVTATIGAGSGASTIAVVAPVTSVDFTAAPDSLILPGAVSGTVTVLGAGGALSGRTVTFSSAPSGVVTISPSPATSDGNGQVAATITGIAPGTTTITATSDTKSDAVSLRVLAGISAIALTPSTDSIIGTGVLALTATASGTSGALSGRPLTVTSSNPAVLTAAPSTVTNTNGSGQVAITLTAVSAGISTVSVTSPEGASVSRVVRVLAPVDHVTISAPGDSVLGTGTLQATATAFDASNNALPGRLITWSASGDAIVNANGLITGVTAPGSAAVTATSEGKAAALLVRVLVGVSTVTVGAPDSTVFVGDTQQAIATPRDASNNPITGRVISWSSSNPAVASVSGTGLITANAPGTATITATVPAENKSGTMPFSVSLQPADSVAVAPLHPTVSLASVPTINFTATVWGGGNVLTGRTVTWSSSDSSKLTIHPNTGVATVKASGQVTVTATTTLGNPVSGTSVVTILP
jgi:uncharacterized protein YjdB